MSISDKKAIVESVFRRFINEQEKPFDPVVTNKLKLDFTELQKAKIVEDFKFDIMPRSLELQYSLMGENKIWRLGYFYIDDLTESQLSELFPEFQDK
jgi:hypothetical protein